MNYHRKRSINLSNVDQDVDRLFFSIRSQTKDFQSLDAFLFSKFTKTKQNKAKKRNVRCFSSLRFTKIFVSSTNRWEFARSSTMTDESSKNSNCSNHNSTTDYSSVVFVVSSLRQRFVFVRVLLQLSVDLNNCLDERSTVVDPAPSECFPFSSTKNETRRETQLDFVFGHRFERTLARRFWNQTWIRDSMRSSLMAKASRM